MSREQPGEGQIDGSGPASSTTRENARSYRSRNDNSYNNGPNSPSPDTAIDRMVGNGKFILAIDCDGLLVPDDNRPGIFTSKSAEDAAEFFSLSDLLTVRTLYKIKVKCCHTCGAIEFDQGPCLHALVSIGNWFVAQFGGIRRYARYETWTNGREDDWSDPDIVLVVRMD